MENNLNKMADGKKTHNLVIIGLFRSSPVHSEGSGNMWLIYILRQSLSLLKFAGCNGWDFADTSGQTRVREPVSLSQISGCYLFYVI